MRNVERRRSGDVGPWCRCSGDRAPPLRHVTGSLRCAPSLYHFDGFAFPLHVLLHLRWCRELPVREFVLRPAGWCGPGATLGRLVSRLVAGAPPHEPRLRSARPFHRNCLDCTSAIVTCPRALISTPVSVHSVGCRQCGLGAAWWPCSTSGIVSIPGSRQFSVSVLAGFGRCHSSLSAVSLRCSDRAVRSVSVSVLHSVSQFTCGVSGASGFGVVVRIDSCPVHPRVRGAYLSS